MSLVLYQKPKLVDILSVCFDARDDEREQHEVFTGDRYDPEIFAARLSLLGGPSWSICRDEKPLLVAGFIPLRPGVYQDWMVSSNAAWADGNWREVTKIARRVMQAMLTHEAHRLQCISLRSRIQAHRWYNILGLRQEGVLEAYGVNGEDAVMFARLKVISDGH